MYFNQKGKKYDIIYISYAQKAEQKKFAGGKRHGNQIKTSAEKPVD